MSARKPNNPAGDERMVVHDADRLLPELVMLGRARQRAADRHLVPHAHEAWEFCCIVEGAVDWHIGGRDYELTGGDGCVTPPGVVHGGTDASLHPCRLYWAQVRLRLRPPGRSDGTAALQGMPAGAAAAAEKALRGLPSPVFPVSPRVPALFADLCAAHEHRDDFAEMAARSALHALIVQFIRDARAHVEQPWPAAIARAAERIEADPAAGASVAQWAEEAGMCAGRFYLAFRRATGMTPNAFRHRCRIRRARAMLRQQRGSVAEIAMSLGYATSQHFATVFKQITALTPLQYRRNAAALARSGPDPS